MKKYLAPLLLLLIVRGNAQQTNSTAGIDATSSVGTASITIGQQDFMNYSSTSVFSTEGVQQPYELFIMRNLWTGATSSNWFDASNWSVGVPTNTIGAIIPSASANQPVIIKNGVASADSLVIESGAKLTNNGTLNLYGNLSDSGRLVNSGGSKVILAGSGYINGTDTFANLEIEGNYSVGASSKDKIYVTEKLIKTSGTLTTSDKLILISNESGSALIEENGGSLYGKAYIQHYTSGSYGYHHFSSPVNGATVSSWSNSFPITGANGASACVQSKVGTLQTYNEIVNTTSLLDSGYYNYTLLSGALTPGKGFTAWLNSLPTLNTFGTPNNGTITFPVTHTAGNNAPHGWNFVGNPYPSPISWAALKSINPGLFGDASCYLWKSTGGKNGVWQAFDGTVGANGAGDIINSSLGFFVYVNATGILTFDNSVRNYSYLSPEIFGVNTAVNQIKVSVSDVISGESDEAVAYTSNTASISRKMAQPIEAKNPTIAFDVKGIKTAINVLKSIDEQTELPLILSTPVTGSYKIQLVANNITLPIYLKDSYSGTFTDVKEIGEVSINTTSFETKNRYSLVFAKPSIISNSGIPMVYPNPSKDKVTIKGTKIESVLVVDNMGKVIKNQIMKDATNPILSISEFKTGFYQFRIQTTDGKVCVVGMIKE